jgi:hypothetical protein
LVVVVVAVSEAGYQKRKAERFELSQAIKQRTEVDRAYLRKWLIGKIGQSSAREYNGVRPSVEGKKERVCVREREKVGEEKKRGQS